MAGNGKMFPSDDVIMFNHNWNKFCTHPNTNEAIVEKYTYGARLLLARHVHFIAM